MTATVRQSLFVVPAICTVARNLGFFEAAGIEVVDVMTPSSTAQRADLDSGRVDVAITSTDNLFAWNASGSDTVVIAQIETTTDQVLVTRPGLPSLTGPGRLRVAVDAPGNGFAVVAYAMLRNLGFQPGSYEVVEVGGIRARYQALRDGQCDVTLLAPPLDEAGQVHGMTPLMRLRDLDPEYPGLGIVASAERIKHAEPLLRGYLATLERARGWIQEAPRDTVGALLAAAGHGPKAISSVIALNPLTLRATAGGLDVLARLRASLDMVLAGAPKPADLVMNDLTKEL
jgi:ABC-type nitrate/sulfonate/bicarbonate transport system substrate-binding protein